MCVDDNFRSDNAVPSPERRCIHNVCRHRGTFPVTLGISVYVPPSSWFRHALSRYAKALSAVLRSTRLPSSVRLWCIMICAAERTGVSYVV